MNINQDIRPITYLKTRAATVLDQLNTTHRPIIITQDGQPRAVIQDTTSYERTRKAIALMKLLAQGEADVLKGRTIEQKRLFALLKKKLNKKRYAKP